MQVNSRALLITACTLLTLSACDYTSSGSDSGVVEVSPTKSTPTGTTVPVTKPGFDGPGGIAGTDDVVAATASTNNLAVVVGATQTLSITFTSSDGLNMTGFGVSGALGSALPSGWSGPTSFVCASVNTGSGCVLNLTYSPTAIDSGSVTITYVVVDNSGMARTPVSMTVAYVATANNNVIAGTAPTGQIAGMTGGEAQVVSVDFFADDGNPVTNFSVTSDLTALPAGWTSASPSMTCAIVSTGNGCLLTLSFAPATSAAGTLTLNYSYTDDAGEPKTGAVTIPYFTTSSNEVIASASPQGQITAVEKTGGRSIPVTFTTSDGKAATNLSIDSNLKSLPAGWSASASSLTCASVSTGNGCQLGLTYAPTALGSGTLSLGYSYVDAAGAARSGVANFPYTATTNDNVVGSPSQTGQITAVVGMGAVPMTVTFDTDDARPATALQLTTNLTSLPPGWSSSVSNLTCSAMDADSTCVLPLSYAPSTYGNGMLTLTYSYINNAGLTKTGNVTIPYRAETNDTVNGAANPATLSVRTGSSTDVSVAFNTNDGNPASTLALTGLSSLPSGWSSSSTSDSFSCNTVSAGTACGLSLTYSPTTAVSGGSLSLPFTYINDAGISGSGTLAISYTAVTPYLYVTDSLSGTVSSCPVNFDNSIGSCGATGSGFNTPYAIAFNGIHAYIANDVGTSGSLVSECTLGAGGSLVNCVATGGGSFTSATSVAVNPAGTFAYVQQSAGLDVCAVAPSTGALSGCVLTGSAYAPLTGFALSSDGTHAYAVHAANALDVCTLASSGGIASCAVSPATVSQAVGTLAVQDGYLYVSNSTGALYACAIGTGGALGGCQTTAVASNAVGITFLASTAYISTHSNTVLVCPVNPDGTLGSCAVQNDATFGGTVGSVVH